MRLKKYAIIIMIILGGTVLACSTISEISGSGDEAPGDVLFEDDFSFIFSGWPRDSDESSSADYVNEGYEIALYEKDLATWATTGEAFTDVDIQVEATFLAGDSDSYYGIVCRQEDIDNFYALAISNDGYYGIFKTIQGGPFTLIPDEFWDYSDSINQGLDTNLLRAKCENDRMILYVNDKLLLEVKDDDIASGEVGLIVGSFTADETTIFFDNFIVRAP
ncbi:MAG: hypothetical protein PVF83_01830 [Anaerolineales bacterium]|jgi:hypothetical protein